MAISRVHETVSVWTKKSGVINKVKVPYLEMKSHNIDAVITDINRLKSTFKNTKSFDAVLAYLEENKIINQTERKHKHSTIVRPSKIMNEDRAGAVMRNIQEGMNEKSIVRSDYYDSSTFTKYSVTADQRKKGDRCVDVINAVHQGMNEKSIINQTRDHFDTIHPTQKPVRLIERLLSLVVPKKPKTEITVADFFAGSMSTMEAVYNMGLTGIAVEIDKEYYLSGKKRLENMPNKQTNLFD
jgi:site-specific DNA-methyltransferase (adenine-specific)